MKRSNEGKACDLVIRHIENRERSSRCEVYLPERRDDPDPVELTCRIGERLFAFEHTIIEPFDRHLKFQVEFPKHLQHMQEALSGDLPPNEHFELELPAMATTNLDNKQIHRVISKIVNWIRDIAPNLPIELFSARRAPPKYTQIPEVPFGINLRRLAGMRRLTQLSVKHLYDDMILEQERCKRVETAYRKKIGKLAAWQKRGARSILIFEENDVQLTNQKAVADALMDVESRQEIKPDEIYLVSSAVDQVWWLYAMRVGDHKYYGLGQSGECLMEIDPEILENVTE